MKTIAQQLNVTEFPFRIKDGKDNGIYYEDSSGYWAKYKFDSHNNQIYYENSNGKIEDNRPMEAEISIIKNRMKSEYEKYSKHPEMDWMEIAARKIL